MTPNTLRTSPAYLELVDASAHIGQDPLQVQGPGGNTSFKSGDLMVIKASGTWLSEARTKNIMVTVNLARIRNALAQGDPNIENSAQFLADDPQNNALRPSIETTVHAVFDHPVVMHTHCVETLAIAVRADAEEIVKERLGSLGAIYVPYVKPGADLARAIQHRVTASTKVIVLGNHGLVSGAATVAEAEAQLYAVAARLRSHLGGDAESSDAFIDDLSDTGWVPVDHAATHAIAHDPVRLAMASGRTLYPDHLIFLGPGIALGRTGETVRQAAIRANNASPSHSLLLIPEMGAAVPAHATPSVITMARCLGDVLARVDPAASLVRLSAEEEAALLNWDAEKYRQSLEQSRGLP